MAVSSRIGGRGVLRRINTGMCSGSGVCARELCTDGDGAGGGSRSRTSSAGGTGGRGLNGRTGLAGMMIEPASMGRTGLGAMSGGELMMGMGSGAGAGSARVVAVAASRTSRAFSTASLGEVSGWGICSEVGILEVEALGSPAGGSGRHSRLGFWQVGQTQSRDLWERKVESSSG